jgi:DNA-binding SARP family transcriptional activator
MSGSEVPLVKITRPVLPGNYPRKRLYRLLDQGRKFPITWVSGPPGCGKTMTVSGYVEARRFRGIWYQVDEGDGDPATFFYYLGLAGRKAASRKSAPLPILTPEFLPGLTTFTHRFFEDLIGRLGIGSVLVFDNCQKAPSESPFFELLREGLSRLPDGVTAILISRSNPPAEFARKRINRLIRLVGWKDLRLTPEETLRIARARGKRRMPGETVLELHRRADGWAAGVTLLLDAEGRGDTGPQRLSRHPPGEIFDYFAEEIFARLGNQMKGFLLRSALLPRMTAGMAQRLTGTARARGILSYLSEHNYFTETHPAPEPVYEYHALFREFLLLRAQSAFPGKDGQRIRREAASILMEEGWAEDAVEHLRMTGDWSGLAQVILKEAPSLIAQGRNRVLADWIRHLPEEHFRSTPWLSYWLGVAIVPFEPANARRLFEDSLARFRRERDAAGVFLSWAGICPAVWFEKMGYEILDSILPLLEELLREFGGFPSPEIEAQALCSMIQALALRLPATIDCDAWIGRAMVVADRISDIPLRGQLLGTIMNYWMCRGVESGKVDSFFASLEPYIRSGELPPLTRIELPLFAAINFLFMAEYDRCLEVVAQGLKQSESLGLHILDMFLLGQGTLAAMHKGDMHSAKNSFRRMASLLPKAMPHDAGFYHYIASWEALGRGDAAKAEHHWKINTDLVMKVGFAFIIYTNRIEGALVMRALGKREEARALLEEARQIESRHRCDRFSYFTKIVESIFLTEDGDAPGGVAKLREGLALAREFSYLGTHFWHPGLLTQIAARALRERIEVPFVREMIRKNRLRPDQEDLDIEEWPWPVRIFTLGRFDILLDGKPVRFPRKAQQRPLLLLKALIALGGREVPMERLGDQLWPDSEGDMAQQALKIALTRLRKILGAPGAVQLRDGRLTLDNRSCWVDAWAFERLLGMADSGRRSAGGARPDGESTRSLEKALSIYRGTFLAGEGAKPWAIPMRERLRSKYLGAVSLLGEEHERAKAFREAIACYSRGLEADDLFESFYQKIIACHARLGERAEALAAYRRCRDTLSAVLGATPSAETERIVRELASQGGS